MTFRMGILALVALLGGCATQQQRTTTMPVDDQVRQTSDRALMDTQGAMQDTPAMNDQVASAALIFEPNLGPYARAVDLPRAPRRQSAFVAWEDQTATYFMVRTDDRQGSGDFWTNGLQRRAIIEKVGVSYR